MKTAKRRITQIMPRDRPGTLVSILTSASRGSSAIAELFVVRHHHRLNVNLEQQLSILQCW